MTMDQKILAVMLDGKTRDIGQIEQAIQCQRKGVTTNTLTTLVRKGKLDRIKRGIYKMADKWVGNRATLKISRL